DGEVLDLATQYDIIEKSGAWYAYKGEKIGQGRENAKAYLNDHPEIMEEVETQVRAIMMGEE
ncbi:MAG TPA: DNA recombination/repair protein RecA, partial [Kandleria vitulina]|nr:DNA recombination/repair protein RecA [Kandleria vitulina]